MCVCVYGDTGRHMELNVVKGSIIVPSKWLRVFVKYIDNNRQTIKGAVK